MVILTVKPGYLPKTVKSYANIEVVWVYNRNEIMANRVDGEMSEITDNDEEDDDGGKDEKNEEEI